MFRGVPRNTTIFKQWVWQYIWILPDSRYTMADLPGLALESEALAADPDNDDWHQYIDYVVPGDNGDVFVHLDTTVQH